MSVRGVSDRGSPDSVSFIIWIDMTSLESLFSVVFSTVSNSVNLLDWVL